YLYNFKKWPVFILLDEEFLLRIELAMIYNNGALIVTRDDMVYAIGNNKNNRLGIAQEESLIKPRKVEILCNKNIKKFANGFYMFALTKKGEVYIWDYKKQHILRYNWQSQIVVPDRLDTPTQLIELREKRIIDIACSNGYFLALTDDGESKPKPVKIEENKIVCIASGWLFNMAVTDTGKIYSWGCNNYGVLGLDLPPPNLSNGHTTSIPRRITTLSNVVIVKVVCGFTHALALTNEGQLYVWGKDQLITDQETRDVCCPVLFNIPQIEKVLDIAAVYHSNRSVALGDDGNVYVWGDYFKHYITFPIATYFSNMQEALMYNITDVYPMILFTDDLGYINVESDILKCSQTLFDNPSTSDLTIVVEEQPIYVHKAILKIRSSYFGAMYRHNWTEKDQSVIKHSKYSYIVYKSFLKYLYTGVISLPMQELLEVPDRLDTPTQLIELREKRIIDIACSNGYFLALTDDGESKPKPVKIEENKIVCIASGWLFNMAVTDTGKIYSWGCNNYGVLGLDLPPPNLSNGHTTSIPRRITTLSNVVIVKVVCGFTHALALTNEGQLYVWGKDQLITDQETRDVCCPVLFNIPQIEKVLDIAAVYHSNRSVALGDDGNVYVWGDYFKHYITFPIATYFSNMQEALMYNITDVYPMILFTDDLGYINVESDILKCSQTLFDNPSTSDLTIVVEEQPIYVHKAILKIRSSYFGAMYRHNWTEKDQSVIKHSKYSYIVYKSFLKYLYTGVISLPMQELLGKL
ncbi:rcc1 and btb domain-containing protein 1, partial [Lasius niger]